MSYNMVVLVLATLFRVGRVWGGARDFLCGVFDPAVPLRASWYLSPLLKVHKF